jgi:hypothetical protein
MPFIFVFRAWENIFYTTLLVHGRLTKAQTSSSSFEEHPRNSLFSSSKVLWRSVLFAERKLKAFFLHVGMPGAFVTRRN